MQSRGEIFEAALVRHHIPHGGHKNVRSGWVGLANCPFCGGGNYYFAFERSSGRMNCWRCGSHKIWDVLHVLFGQNAGAVWQEMKGAAPPAARGRPDHRPQWPRFKPPPGVGPLTRAHTDYLRSRGFGPETARIWGLRGIAGGHGRFSWRVYAPWAYQGRTATWQLRAVGRAEPRYIAAKPEEEAIHINDLLYGEDLVRGPIIVVEGITDAWAIGPGTVALGGLAWYPVQFRKLIRYPVRYICFDNEPEAQRRARKLEGELAAFPGVTRRLELDAADPGLITPQERALVRRSCFGD